MESRLNFFAGDFEKLNFIGYRSQGRDCVKTRSVTSPGGRSFISTRFSACLSGRQVENLSADRQAPSK